MGLERRRGAAPVDAVAVGPRLGGTASVKLLSSGFDSADGDVVGKLRVQRLGGALGRRPALGVYARNLRQRVDARVGPPGHRKLVPAREDVVERPSHDSLHGPQAGLCGPAPKAPAVVLERQLEPHVRGS